MDVFTFAKEDHKAVYRSWQVFFEGRAEKYKQIYLRVKPAEDQEKDAEEQLLRQQREEYEEKARLLKLDRDKK